MLSSLHIPRDELLDMLGIATYRLWKRAGYAVHLLQQVMEQPCIVVP